MATRTRTSPIRVAQMWVQRCAADAPKYKDYVEEKKKKNEKPLDEDAWEAQVLGKGEKEDKEESGGGAAPENEDDLEEVSPDPEDPEEQERVPAPSPPPPSLDDALEGDDGPASDLVEDAKKKKWAPRKKVREIYEWVKKKVDSFGEDVSQAERDGSDDLLTWLVQWLGVEGTSLSKKPDLVVRAPSMDDSGSGKPRKLAPAQAEALTSFAKAKAEEDSKAKKELEKAKKDFAPVKKEHAEKKKLYDEELGKVLPKLEAAGLAKKDLTKMRAHAKKLKDKYEADKQAHEKDPKGAAPKEPNYQAEWEKSNPKLPKLPKEDYKAVQTLGDPPKAPKGPKSAPAKTPAETKADFLKSVDDPKMKKRFEEMSDEEFMAALKSMSKRGALRAATIRLAYVRPDLREYLVNALRES